MSLPERSCVASAPDTPGVVTGRVDRDGRLVSADAPLAALQAEAGSSLGARLALPQLAAVARLARDLGVPISRSVLTASAEHDYDLWVRATLDGDEVTLAIEGWQPRSPATPRLDLVLPGDDEASVARDPEAGSWATDARLRLTALAPDLAERLRVAPRDAIGQPLTRFFKLAEGEAGDLPILAAVASQEAFGDQQCTARDADSIQLILSGDPLIDEGGQFAGFAGRAVPVAAVLALVEERPLALTGEGFNAELDRALRSPLDRIIAAADTIVERSDGPLRTDYATYAGDIAAAGRHLLSVIHAMNDGAPVAAERIDLIGAASEAVALVASAGEAKGVAVDLMASCRVFAHGEKGAIVQVIVNILGNAVRYSPPGVPVTISIASHDDRATLTVADRGPGIAPEDQQRIFERYERLGSSEPGTGLGLAIARRLAESMEGMILLDSAPGEGSRFTLDLPLA